MLILLILEFHEFDVKLVSILHSTFHTPHSPFPTYHSPLTILHSPFRGLGGDHSLRKLCTGFAAAALTAWKLTVINAISNAIPADAANNHQERLIR